MNLNQLNEILIVNDKKFSIFESKIYNENYRIYFFSLFENVDKIYTFDYKPTNETFTALFKEFHKKRQREILTQIWIKAIREINDKKLNIGHLNYETILKKRKINITNLTLRKALNKYMYCLKIGSILPDAKKNASEEILESDESDEMKKELLRLFNDFTNIINETLTKAEIEIN